MSANNDEAKVSRTFDGTQKTFPMFMTWIKGVLMQKGIIYITKATFENLLPKSENESSQTADQKQTFKDNQIRMGIVTMNVTLPSLIVKIENLMTEEWPSGLFHKVIKILNEKYRQKDMMSRAMQKQELIALKLNEREKIVTISEQTSRVSILNIKTT